MRADRQPAAARIPPPAWPIRKTARRAVQGGQEQQPARLQQPGQRAQERRRVGHVLDHLQRGDHRKPRALGQQVLGHGLRGRRAAGPARRHARGPPRSPRRRRRCPARHGRAAPAPRPPARRRSRHPAPRLAGGMRVRRSSRCAAGSSGAAAASARPGPTSAPPARRTARFPRGKPPVRCRLSARMMHVARSRPRQYVSRSRPPRNRAACGRTARNQSHGPHRHEVRRHLGRRPRPHPQRRRARQARGGRRATRSRWWSPPWPAPPTSWSAGARQLVAAARCARIRRRGGDRRAGHRRPAGDRAAGRSASRRGPGRAGRSRCDRRRARQGAHRRRSTAAT